MATPLGLLVWDSFLQMAKGVERRFYAPAYSIMAQLPAMLPPLPKEPETLLIFKPDDIGDAVQALPAIQDLKERFPQAQLFLLCQNKTLPVYERSGLFQEIVSVPIRTWGVRFQSFDVISALARFSVSEFDLAIFLRSYPMFFREFLKINAKTKLHPRDPRLNSASPFQSKVELGGNNRPPMATQLRQIVAPLVTEKIAAKPLSYPSFQWSETDRAEVVITLGNKIPENYGVLHPYNRFETKRYPIRYWTELLKQISGVTQWYVIGAEGDPDVPFGINLKGKLSLSATGYLLSQARVFVGNESGPGHWAAAMGVPTITLMGGHSHPQEWSAIGRTLTLHRTVECSPCHRRVCPFKGLKCLEGMEPKFLKGPIADFLLDPTPVQVDVASGNDSRPVPQPSQIAPETVRG